MSRGEAGREKGAIDRITLLVCPQCGRDELATDDPAGDATRGDLHDLNNP